MSRLRVNSEALAHNIQVIDGWIRKHGASWTLVTKVLCGEPVIFQLLYDLGIRSWGDSRLENVAQVGHLMEDSEVWYLRLPHLSFAPKLVRLASVSLNSEIPILAALSQAAVEQQRVHRVVLMVEMGDLREGILPGALASSFERARALPGIEILGLGTNLGCLSGAVPSIDQLNQLIIYREWLEGRFGVRLPVLSAGSSVVLPLLLRDEVPTAINHFRIGDSAFLGTDLFNGGCLKGLRDDVFTFEAEVLEIMEKSLVSQVETAEEIHPFPGFKTNARPGQRGWRALIGVGQLDTDMAGLTPVNPKWQLAGASSDVSVVNLDQRDGLRIGDTIRFRPNYASLLQLMHSRYVEKVVEGLPIQQTLSTPRATRLLAMD